MSSIALSQRMPFIRFSPYVLLLGSFLLHLLMFWPGIVSPDGASQFQTAKLNLYNDHHPPMMGFVWLFLNKIHAGPGLMWLFHMLMLYSSSFILMRLFRHSRFQWYYAALPMVPTIFIYTPLLVKDNGFCYSYLLTGCIISYLVFEKVKELRYKLPLLSLAVLLLFYGTAVKFQAKFILIAFALGWAYCLNYKFNTRNFVIALLLCAAILKAVFMFNNWLVPNKQQSHSWQFVKLYDLASISLALNKPLLPDFVLESPHFSMEALREKFDPSNVDPLVFTSENILVKGKNEQERQLVMDYWKAGVKAHPFLYLKHRLTLWSYNLTTAPCKGNHPYHFLKDTRWGRYAAMPIIYNTLGGLHALSLMLLKFIWFVPLLFYYCYLGIRALKLTPAAIPLLILNVASLMLMAILLFLSMAATARYIYFCVCLLHASHGFAYLCWKANKDGREAY